MLAGGSTGQHGMVHRDLKPGNLFIENGIVKIGDYGLSKFISASRRSGQTVSIGSVHYNSICAAGECHSQQRAILSCSSSSHLLDILRFRFGGTQQAVLPWDGLCRFRMPRAYVACWPRTQCAVYWPLRMITTRRGAGRYCRVWEF
jgi:hypothetical protein